jgi:hypothetical protein
VRSGTVSKANELANWLRASVWRSRMLVVLSYGLLAVLFSWPLPMYLADRAVLARGDDFYQNIWNIWWVKFSLLALHQHPYHTDYLHYPTGQSLLYHVVDPLNGVMSIPLQWAFGLLAAFNLMRLMHLVFSGVAAYALCRVLGLPRPAAWVGGALFVICPVVSNSFDLGQLDVISTGWIPLYILCLMKGLGNRALNLAPGRWGWLLGAACALTAATLGSWYFSTMLVLFTTLYVAWELVTTWLQRPSAYGPFALRLVGRAAIVAVAATLFLSPLIIALMRENAEGGGYIISPLSTIIANSADLLAPFLPVPAHYNDLTINPNGGNPALGWTVMALAAIALVLRRAQSSKFQVQSSYRTLNFELGRAHLYFWLIVAVSFTLIALGPHLLVRGNDTGVPMPYLLLNKLPFLGTARVPSRFMVVASLAMAVLAAYGLVALAKAVRSARGRSLVFAAVGMLVVVEYLGIPRILITPTVHPYFKTIAAAGSEGAHQAVLELPLAARVPPSMLDQTVHQRPILEAYTARKYPYPWFDVTPGVAQLSKMNVDALSDPDILSPPVGDTALAALDYYGIRYVAVYTTGNNGLDARTADVTGSFFSAHEIEPDFQDAAMAVYKVPPQPRTGPMVGLGDGWYTVEESEERRWRWTDGHAWVQVTNPTEGIMQARIRLKVYTVANPRTMLLLLDGDEVARNKIGPYPAQALAYDLDLSPGEHWLELISTQPPESPPAERRPLSLGFEEVAVQQR